MKIAEIALMVQNGFKKYWLSIFKISAEYELPVIFRISEKSQMVKQKKM